MEKVYAVFRLTYDDTNPVLMCLKKTKESAHKQCKAYENIDYDHLDHTNKRIYHQTLAYVVEQIELED